MREMRMVCRLLMVLLAMVLGSIALMLGRCLVVVGGLFVMLGQFGRIHCGILRFGGRGARGRI